MKPFPKIPEDLKFPVSLNTFLRYAAGGKYKDDREAKYTGFLADGEQFHRFMIEGRAQGKQSAKEMPKPTRLEAREILNHHRAKAFTEFEFWNQLNAFRTWLSVQRSENARHAAKTKWSQARRHKANAPKIKTLLDVAGSD
jgi:hypothetical protein